MESRSNPRILLTTSLGAFVTPFTSSAISFAVPDIGSYWHASFTVMVWVPVSYLISLSSLMILFGKLSDIFGRSRFYLLGLFIFGSGAILATFSNSIYLLIFSTLIMGSGVAFLSVNSTAIVSTVYTSDTRGGALGINAMSVYLGLTAAPVISGTLIDVFGWRAIFYLVAALSFFTIIPAYLYLRKIEFVKNREKIDLTGFFMFLVSILMLVLYLSYSELYGFIQPIYMLFIGLLLLSIFVIYERHRKNAILDLSLFTKNRTFAAANFTAFLNYVSTFAIVFVFSIYFNVISGLGATESGLILTVQPILMVIFSPLSGKLSDRFGSRGLSSLGMLVISFAFFLLYFMIGNSKPVDLVIPLGIVGIGFGIFSAPNTNSVMGSVARRQTGTASGILGTMRFIGQLMSLSLMSTILAYAMPKNMLIALFSGITANLSLLNVDAFVSGLRSVMLISGILSFAGVFTSLIRNR